MTLAEGQLVYIRNFAQSKKVDKFTSKLSPKYVGPFKIKRKLSYLTYELEYDKGHPAGRWQIKDLKIKPEN